MGRATDSAGRRRRDRRASIGLNHQELLYPEIEERGKEYEKLVKSAAVGVRSRRDHSDAHLLATCRKLNKREANPTNQPQKPKESSKERSSDESINSETVLLDAQIWVAWNRPAPSKWRDNPSSSARLGPENSMPIPSGGGISRWPGTKEL